MRRRRQSPRSPVADQHHKRLGIDLDTRDPWGVKRFGIRTALHALSVAHPLSATADRTEIMLPRIIRGILGPFRRHCQTSKELAFKATMRRLPLSLRLVSFIPPPYAAIDWRHRPWRTCIVVASQLLGRTAHVTAIES